MTDQVKLVEKIAALLKAGDPKVSDLLSEDVTYASLNIEVGGHAAVHAHLTGEMGQIYREADWIDARPHGDAVQITARSPEASPQPSKILLFHFRDGQVNAIQEQLLLPMKPSPVTPLCLTPELKDMVNTSLATGHPMLLSYVDESGQPVLSFRGSVQVFSDDQLAIWVRNAGGNLLRAIAKNPKVALMYRDEGKRATFQFQGRAWIARGERVRLQVYEASPKVERDHDYAALGVAVIIDLDRVEGYSGVMAGGVFGGVNMRR